MASQKRANDTLQEYDDATQALLNAFPGGAVLIEVDGTIVTINNAAVRRSGKRIEELIGAKIFDLFPSDLTKARKAHVDEVVRSGKPLRFQDVRDDIRFDHSLYPLFDQRHQVHQVAIFSQDITEMYRVQTEHTHLKRQVDQQARTLSGILSASADLIYVFDKDIRYKYVNLPGARALGMVTQDIVGKTWKELGLPRKSMRHMITLADVVFATGSAQTGELQWDGPEGATLYYECIFTPIVNVHGEVDAVVSTCRDITKRKETEIALAESELKYRELVESANSIILKMDTKGIITFINEFGQRFFGHSESELIGRHIVGTIMPKTETSGRDMKALADDIVAHPKAYQDNVNENITKDGRRVWVSWTNRAIYTEGAVNGILCVGNDITALKHAEAALQKAHDELEQKVEERTLELQNEIEERKKSEEALIAERDRLETVTKNVTAGLAIVSREYRTVWVNKVLKQEYGEVEGKLCYEVYNRRTDVCPGCGAKQIFETGIDKVMYEREGRDALGNITWSQVIDTAMRDDEGNIIGVLKLTVPITERKRAEEVLKRAHDELEQKVQERTRELQVEIEEHKVTEEELRTSTEELEE
ncbi:MAG: PAS domain S-box protein, partial [Halobacteriota archaeon]